MDDHFDDDVSMIDELESGVAVGFAAFDHAAAHNTRTYDNDDIVGDDYDEQDDYAEDDFEDDVSMNDHLEHAEDPAIMQVMALHKAAEHNLAIKTSKIPREIMLLPSLHSIYFHPEEAVVPQVPPHFQLAAYFTLYNDIAKANFLADKSLSVEINEAIWFYGLDKAHSFSRFFDQIRYNIILMAFVWASNFDPRYCKEGCKEFVKAFLRAWIESLVYQYDPSHNRFTRRESFIDLWQNSPFELHYFSQRRGKTVSKILTILRTQLAYMSNVPTPANFLQAVRRGELDEDIFEKFGAAMTLQWLVGLNEKAHERQNQIDADNVMDQAKLRLQRAEASYEAVQARIASKSVVEHHQMADVFDPFQRDVHPGMSKVEWDGDILASLLRPIDDDLEHPSKVKDKPRPAVDETSFWVSHEQVKAIFQEDASKPEPSRGLAELTVLMETTVVEPTIE